MNDREALGRAGEDLVTRHFIEAGFEILARNWRGGGGEIDIVAAQDDTVVFVEVRTRSSHYMASPTLTVDAGKQRRVGRSAEAWLAQSSTDYEHIRFDVVGIVLDGRKVTDFDHVEDAFVPPWAC